MYLFKKFSISLVSVSDNNRSENKIGPLIVSTCIDSDDACASFESKSSDTMDLAYCELSPFSDDLPGSDLSLP